jgi:hypothetical protein
VRSLRARRKNFNVDHATDMTWKQSLGLADLRPKVRAYGLDGDELAEVRARTSRLVDEETNLENATSVKKRAG